MRRHDFIYVDSAAWRALIETRHDLATDPLIAHWADRGWPLIGRRANPEKGLGVPAGLPLPPFAGKRRLALMVPPTQIRTVTPPPALSAVLHAAPESWRPTLERIGELAATYSVDTRIFGSLAWQSVTGLDYLTQTSDLDVLFHTHRAMDLRALAKGLAKIDARSPMRIDGEFVRNDGAAVNWREFHSGAAEILIKTIEGVGFVEASGFALGRPGQ